MQTEEPKTEPLTSIDYVKVTGANVIVETEIPKIISYDGELVSLPRCFQNKQDFVRVSAKGEVTNCSHIHPALGNALNALTLTGDAKADELTRAIEGIHKEVSTLVKDKFLKGKSRRGAASFSQSSEAVPYDSIVISKDTYDKLCADNSKWKRTSHVFCVRFPNLGDRTTLVLRLIVDSDPIDQSGTISEREAGSLLRDLMAQFGLEDKAEVPFGCFWMNPRNLKDDLQGDGDGDTVYIAPYQRGFPKFTNVEWDVKPGEVNQDDVDTLFRKAGRTTRTDLKSYIGQYFDTPMIGPCTYMIRFCLRNEALKYAEDKQPMHRAWQQIGPWGIPRVEICMDFRKGDDPLHVVLETFEEIAQVNNAISQARRNGDWFAKVVTSSAMEDPGDFIMRFEDLGEFADIVVGKLSG